MKDDPNASSDPLKMSEEIYSYLLSISYTRSKLINLNKDVTRSWQNCYPYVNLELSILQYSPWCFLGGSTSNVSEILIVQETYVQMGLI